MVDIQEYIKECDYYKNDTPDAVETIYDDLVKHGYSPEKAIELIEWLSGSIRNEFGC